MVASCSSLWAKGGSPDIQSLRTAPPRPPPPTQERKNIGRHIGYVNVGTYCREKGLRGAQGMTYYFAGYLTLCR